MWEQPLTIPQMVDKYKLPESFFRNGCKRPANKHPMPHVKSGTSKPTIYIRPSSFERWYEEEEAFK